MNRSPHSQGCAQPYQYTHCSVHCSRPHSCRTTTVHRLGLLTLLQHPPERSQEDRSGSSGCFFSGFREKAMPREQSSPLSTCWLGMTGCPRSAKSLTFSTSEQRMNFVITLLMFFPDAQRTGRNQVKSVSGQEKFSLSSPSSKGNFVGEKRVLPCPYEILANSASNSTERTSCSRFFSILDCAPSPVCSPPENI